MRQRGRLTLPFHQRTMIKEKEKGIRRRATHNALWMKVELSPCLIIPLFHHLHLKKITKGLFCNPFCKHAAQIVIPALFPLTDSTLFSSAR